MKYYVYVLQSQINGDIYVGSTADVSHRVQLHNNGRVKSTKGYRPWKLVDYQEFDSRSEAVKRERLLKSGQQKEILKKEYMAT